jgi:hypothetical protein
MAAPHVAGALAVLREARPDASVDELLEALQQTGKAVTDSRSGGGATAKPRIQVDEALDTLRASAGALRVVTSTLPRGTVGRGYSATLQAGQGEPPYSWAITSGSLPAGLSLDSATGALSGVPSGSAGVSTFTITVTDSAAATGSASRELSLSVAGALTFAPATALAPAMTARTYRTSLAASGGSAPYTWSIASGSLPAGLSLDASTGALTGVPSSPGTSTVTFRVTDADAATVTGSATIRVFRATDDYSCASTTFEWRDLAEVYDPTSTRLREFDGMTNNVRLVPLQFSFPFYNEIYANVWLSMTGFISTANPRDYLYENTPIPQADIPAGLIAPLWDDLADFSYIGDGFVWTHTSGPVGEREFIATWQDVRHWDAFFDQAPSSVQFQVVLNEGDGSIVFAYQDVTFGNAALDGGASATVGLQSPDGSRGVEISFNAPTLSGGTAYRCQRGVVIAPPSAPLSVQAGLVGGAPRVSWQAPLSSGGETVVYDVRREGLSTPVCLGVSELECRPTVGVLWGSPQRFSVTARNSAGASSAVFSPSVTPPRSVPDVSQVSSFGVVAGNGSLGVSWVGMTSAAVGRGAAVSRVEVRATSVTTGRAQTCSVVPPRGGVLPSSCVVSRLVNGQVHTVQVRAQNSLGWSGWVGVSASSSDRTPVAVVPDVVTSVAVRLNRGLPTVSWRAPRSDGGAPVSYRVEVQDGGGWRAVTGCTALVARTVSCAVPSSVVSSWGVAHRFRVQASNMAGPAGWVESPTVVPFTLPDASQVSSFGVVAGNGSLGVSWVGMTSAAVGRGAAVSRVEVRATSVTTGRAQTCSVVPPRGGVLPSSCVVSRLVNGQVHTVQVRAQNSLGWSGWVGVSASSSDRTPVAVVPDVVTSVAVRLNRGLPTVSWRAPRSDGGAPVSYRVEVQDGGGWRAVTGCTALVARTVSCAVPSSVVSSWGVAHRFRVQASNMAGPAGWVESPTVVPFTLPDPSAAAYTPTSELRAIRVAWTGVTDLTVSRGSPVTRVEVRATPVGATGRARTCTANAPRGGVVPVTCTVSSLASGVTHLVEVRLTNAGGTSAWRTIGTLPAN